LPAPFGETNPVRDVHADGDTAMIKIDEGMDLNNSGAIDNVSPGSVGYGFEEFTDTRVPGYIYDGGTNVGTGSGTYEQFIDARGLSEGRHYITVRAFRHRDAATGGDGGPAVYTDFRRTVYVDRLPPESQVLSFAPYASDPTNPDNRDLILQSVDKTADRMHVLLDLPAEMSESQVLAMVGAGNQAGDYDRDQFIYGFNGVKHGNHTVTIVTYEITGNYNVQRFVGFATDTNVGLGLGDLNGDGFIRAADLLGGSGFLPILMSQNTLFDAAADSNGDGLVDNRDLFDLEAAIVAGTNDGRVYAAYEDLLAARGDLDGNDVTDRNDLALLYAGLGGDDWLLDLNVDGTVDLADAEVFVTQLLRTSPGDFNLDGIVSMADYAAWRDGLGGSSLADGDFDGDVDGDDYALWRGSLGFERDPFAPGTLATATIPEPGTLVLLTLSLGAVAALTGSRSRQS
jgi:hypothetical protein